jgi:hypothetical protein
MKPAGRKVVDDLRILSTRQPIDRLELNQHLTVTYEIRPVANTQMDLFVIDWHFNLSSVRNAPQTKFHLQGRLIYRFQKSRSQNSVRLHGRAYYRISLGIRPIVRLWFCSLRHLCNLWANGQAHGTKHCTEGRINADHGFFGQSPRNATARQNAASPPLNFQGKHPTMQRLFCSSGASISPPRFSMCMQSWGNSALWVS